MTAPLDRLLQDLRAALEDRNRTSHLYNAAMAEDVFSRIPHYHALMVAVTQKL